MNTLFIGRKIIELDTTPSTNSYANELLKEKDCVEGTIVFTQNQTQGRGQRNTYWQSEAMANLTFSLVLKPSFLSASQQFLLSKTMALGIADFVAEELKHTPTPDKISIKWPNDLYVGNKKIAGILIENTFRAEQWLYSVVGIGLNVNQLFDETSTLSATSLKKLGGEELSIKDCLSSLCKFIEIRYLHLKTLNTSKINEDYLNLLYKRNEWAMFKKSDESLLDGMITNVDSLGRLVVKTKAGILDTFDFKEIRFIES